MRSRLVAFGKIGILDRLFVNREYCPSSFLQAWKFSGGHSAGRRAPNLKAYLQRAPGARPHVPVNKDAALAEFQKVAAAFPVFRLASRR